GTAMGGYGKQFGGPLGSSEIDALIAFIRGGTKPTPLEPRPTTGRAARGSDVFRTNCESCHGTPNQRRDSVHLPNAVFLEAASDAYRRVAIEEGRPGTRMEAWRGKLSSQQIEDVVAYLRSLARPVSPPPPAAGEGQPAREGPVVINSGGAQASFTMK